MKINLMSEYIFEEHFRAKGFEYICGIDEAGRGPLAGPVVAAAVILDTKKIIKNLNDSKKIKEEKREVVCEEIKIAALDYAIGEASVEEIDNFNILNSTFLAMKRAVLKLKKLKPDLALVDGSLDPGINVKTYTLVKGDTMCASIAAASILAKVHRDKIMLEMHKKYPTYNFERHKGYPTKEHRKRIKECGICKIHRKTFHNQ